MATTEITTHTFNAESLLAQFPSVVTRPSLDHPSFNVPSTEILAVLSVLKSHYSFDFLVDLTAVDWAEGATPRFTIIYHLLSTTTHQYVRLAADCLDNEAPSVPSITSLWPSANWHERETFDMFGIQFTSHPDLRRILMWDGYPYHPLRKEFPLAGIETELPDVEVAAETKVKVRAAPMAGGPFVALSGQVNMTEAEPMAKDQSWTEKSEKPE